LDRRYALHVDRPLDLAALKAGAQHLVGEHDFASFGQPMSKDGEKDGTPLQAARPSAGLTQDLRSTVAKSPWACAAGTGRTTRCIYEADWTRSAGPGGRDWLVFDVSGNAFLRGMVRNMVGSLLQVGLGLWPADRIAEVLALRERSACAAPPSGAAPAPACGLCLMQVDYE
jgi:tRNA pseudouridine38-40 synthase